MKGTIFIILLLVSLTISEKARYDNYRVFEISIETSQQLQLMEYIESNPDGYRFMEFPGKVGRNAELVVPPHKFAEFEELCSKFSLKSALLINNLQEVFDQEQPRSRRALPLDWTRYWTLEEIHSWMESIAAENSNASIISVGTSYEGRNILGLKLNIGNVSGKKQIIFEGTIHAREWISGATVTWMLNELLTSTDPEVQQLAATYEWIIVPVLNVDGFVYTWTNDRFWRKTRRPTANLLCRGADPNRNWDNNFNRGGSSSNPCSDLYAGDYPFSEPETKQFSEFIANLTNLVGYFDFHAYGQLLMLPYGFTTEILENYDELYEIGTIALESLSAKFGTQYRIGSIANIIYIASGSSLDWLKYEFKTNVTYAYELRDQGRYGFALPADQIIDTAIETFESIKTILKEAQIRGIA
ncbi:hypothetical protein PVAND_006029 [Polypedilum vanderplanki]|uniref:Zinc carboxypeptidase A 1 n=1 Tax=Polypedilum vanderplanki TaxID=319348 RepID=A0A9J6C1X6_POLVA|nr:hypothetical protein PVAND_006029 [Polypedilum vanderplanki]